MKLRFVFPTVSAMLAGMLALSGQASDFRPVTDAMLRNPDPADWLHWRRTDNAWGYSPLDQINRQNVQQMQLAWSWAIETGTSQPTPLVHDGVMYLPNPRNVVQALDAANGDLMWEYRRDLPEGGRGGGAGGGGGEVGGNVLRSLSMAGDKIFVNTTDAHLVALDARTGKVVWDTTVADSKLGYTYTSGAIVVRGAVISGLTGCTRYKDDACFITGHDAATGRELWRTSTIARPGEPGGDTWGDLPLQFRAGGDAWIPGSYDPELNLVYWGTAQAKPWARAVRGTDGDALYTDSTLALNPDTGKMVWYYQHIPGETQDMDEVFENILVDTGGRKSLFKMGKLGILWQIDRTTGQFVSAADLGYQTILRVEPRTGQVTYRDSAIPKVGVEADFCPSTAGFKSLRAMAFSPRTNAFYIPLNLNCEKGTFGPVERVVGRGGSGPVRRKNYIHPAADGNLGEFVSMDMKSGKVLWRHRVRTPFNTAALTTGGGLVFAGDWDRNMYAYDEVTGKILWQTRLPTSTNGFPVSYAVGGRQYIVIPAGNGGASWNTLLPAELTPEKHRPNGGNGLFVFALPGDRGPAKPAR